MRKLLISIILSSSGILFLSCGRDCPTCNEELGPRRNYRLYALDRWRYKLISIDVPADTIVDSTSAEYETFGIFLTPDGERLLVPNIQAMKTEVYSTRNLSHIGTIDKYGDYYFDGADNIAIYNGLQEEEIYFIDPMTLTAYDPLILPSTSFRWIR